MKLHWQILIALLLAVLVGYLTGPDGELFGIRFLDIYSFLGTMFLNALKMIIVPLIMSSIITGIAGIGGRGTFGRLGWKTLLYYFVTSLLAILVGLAAVNVMQPGIVDGEPARDIIALDDTDLSAIEQRVAGKGAGDVVEIFIRMIPTNIVAAAAEGQMLGLIFFSLLFGYFMTRIEEARSKGVITDAEAREIMSFDEKVMAIIAVDDFDPSELPRKPGVAATKKTTRRATKKKTSKKTSKKRAAAKKKPAK